MKKKSSLLLADRIDYEDLVKEAFLGAVTGAGRFVMRNKMLTLGALSNTSDIAGAASKAGGAGKRTRELSRMVQTPPINM